MCGPWAAPWEPYSCCTGLPDEARYKQISEAISKVKDKQEILKKKVAGTQVH